MPSDIFMSPETTPEQPEVTPMLKAKSAKEQRDSLEINITSERTYLVLMAVHKDAARNVINKVSCKKGIAIGGYVYDSQSDAYHLSCVDYMQLGYIPVSMVLTVGGVHRWEVRMPLAESVIKRYLTPEQKRDIKRFKSVYRPEDHYTQFVQMISCE